MIEIWVDGGTRNNEICLVDTIKNKTIIKKRDGILTNNELEYLAMIYALEYCNNVYSKQHVVIYSDSMLIVNQVNGDWRITTERLGRLHEKCISKLNDRIKIKWISRRFNLAGHVLEKS